MTKKRRQAGRERMKDERTSVVGIAIIGVETASQPECCKKPSKDGADTGRGDDDSQKSAEGK